jgi:amino acid transporter
MLYVWIFGSVLATIAGICLAEICSKMPYAGSVYHWAGELGGKEHGPALSYATGWFNFIGNATSAVGYSFGFGQFVASLYDIRHPNDQLSLGMQVLIAMLGTALMVAINILRIDYQAYMNNINLFFSLGSLIVICCYLMLSDSPKQSVYWAFTTTFNSSGFDDFPYVVLTGTLTLLFGVAGYEASAHLAEETVNARFVAPWGMVFNIVTTCSVGFIYLLFLVLCMGNDGIDDVINTNYANSGIAVFNYACGPDIAFGLTVLIVIMAFMAGLANLTVTARVGWAMARDGAFPGSEWLRKIHPETKSPVNMILAIFVFDLILLLIPLGSPLAFTAITSISTIGYQVSYLIPIVLRLTSGNFEPDGAFNLGVFSKPLHIISAIFLAVTGVFMFFPTQAPIIADSFNWAIPVTPAYVIVGALFWYYDARHYFKGPLLREMTPTDSIDFKF